MLSQNVSPITPGPEPKDFYQELRQRQNQLAMKALMRGGQMTFIAILGIVLEAEIWAQTPEFTWGLEQQIATQVVIGVLIIVFLWFLASSYKYERILEEEYAHKANCYAAYSQLNSSLESIGPDRPEIQTAAAAIIQEMARQFLHNPLTAVLDDSSANTPEPSSTDH